MENRFLGLIEDSVKKHWDLPALTDYKGETIYYKDFAKEITKNHILFKQLGINKGDKIALIGRNSSHWAICFFSILSYGAVAIPILHEFKSENIHQIINHSDSITFFVANQIWNSLSIDSMPNVHTFLSLDNFSILHSKNLDIITFQKQINDHFQQLFPNGFTSNDVKFHVEKSDELAIINYTSGTTGFSKGVMIPFQSLWSNTKFAEDRLPFIHSGDNFVSMLPMAHMYGLAFEILNGINKGCHIHFLPRVPNPQSILESFSKIKPRLIIVVPLIIEKIVKNNIFPLIKRPLFQFFIKLPIFKQIIYKKIAAKLNQTFGDNFFEIIIGGAALNKDVELFLKSIKFRYTVGYGMTECGPLVSYEQWDSFKTSSVGRVVDRMEIKIDSTNPEKIAGEILVKGTNLMLGYYKNPAETKEVMLQNGWMCTGDLGTLDKDGFLFIRGRSKTMLLSSNGQNIYPEEIETIINSLPYIVESLVIEREGKLVALVYPLWERIEKEGLTEQKINEIMGQNLTQLNLLIPHYCKITNIIIQKEGFEKTPKQSIKRFLYQNK